MPDDDEHRAELVRRIRDDLGRGMTPDFVILDEAEAFEGEVLPAVPKTGLFQSGQLPVPYSAPPALPDDLPEDPAERLMAIFMLRAARFAPRGGTIRFSAIDRTEAGDHVVRQAEINTEDARRIAKEQGL